MKRLLLTTVAGLSLLALATPSFARGDGKDKECTITGEAKCAKCSLKESAKCQTVVQVENKEGKKVTYYLDANDVAKGFHKNVCQGEKKVTVTGTVKEVEGKQQLAASKIELAKD